MFYLTVEEYIHAKYKPLPNYDYPTIHRDLFESAVKWFKMKKDSNFLLFGSHY